MLVVARDILDYVKQMIPLGLTALAVLLILCPLRLRRLRARNLTSSLQREGALILFAVFCAGLAALTLFPANLWAFVFDRMFQNPQQFRMVWGGLSWTDFYPRWKETAARFEDLSHILAPLEEISRALNRRSYWLMFMLLGNIIMFIPLGFFPALLWRGWRWWNALLTGFCASVTIEFIQFFIGRSTDIDDVILNTAGALLGFWMYCLLRALFPKLLETFHCQPKGGALHG